MSGGVPAGATRPTAEPTSTPGRPASAKVGTSGNDGDAFAAGRGERAQLAVLDQRQQRIERADEHVDAPGQQIRDRGGGAAERHVDEIDARRAS